MGSSGGSWGVGSSGGKQCSGAVVEILGPGSRSGVIKRSRDASELVKSELTAAHNLSLEAEFVIPSWPNEKEF